MTITEHVPHRWLRLTSPPIQGLDVVALQKAVNNRLRARGRKGVVADGHYGPATRDAVRTVLWYLGCPAADLDNGALIYNQRIIRDPDNRSSGWLDIARDRKLWLSDQDAGSSGFVNLLRSYLGKVETPINSNRGPWLDPLHIAAGFAPATCPPYCAIGLIALFRKAGLDEVRNGWAYTPSWVNSIRTGELGWKSVKKEHRKPGDVFFIKIPGASNDSCDHVGAIENESSTIEFNTSSGRSGSQNNGGGVYRREWSDRSNMVVCIGRPPWN